MFSHFLIVPFMRYVENTVEPDMPQMTGRMHIACWRLQTITDLPLDVDLFILRYAGYIPFTCPSSCDGVVIVTCGSLGRVTSCSRYTHEIHSRESTGGVSRVIYTQSLGSE
jgi:hypothetical protein